MRSNLGLTCNVGRDTSNIERYIAAPENGASIIERALVLPLEGKGDRSAVDEVNVRQAPLREA